MYRPALFFTWDVSLATWRDKGLLAREVHYYQSLAKRGVDVTFLTWGGAEDTNIAASTPALQGITVVPLYTRLPRPKCKALRFAVSFLAPFAVAETLRAADVFKTNQMWGGWVAALARLLFRKPLIVRTGFELYDFTCKQGHGAARRTFIWLLSRITYAAASQIIVASDDDSAFVQKHFGQTARKIIVRPNWIDTDLFAPDGREKNGRVLCVARLTAQKNLTALIHAIAGTDMTLDLIGQGEEEATLKALARETGAQVNFLGNVANDQLPSYYNACSVFALVSHYEGNPKALLEAMACGCAVVGADAPGINSVIRHEHTGWLCGPEPESIRQALLQLLQNPALGAHMGKNARQHIIDRHSLDKLAAAEIASRPGGDPRR